MEVDSAEVSLVSLRAVSLQNVLRKFIFQKKKKIKLKEINLKSSNEKHAVDSLDGRVSPSGQWWLGSLIYQNATSVLKPMFAPLKTKTFTAIEQCRAHLSFKKNMQVSSTRGNVIFPLYKMSGHIFTYFPWYP